LRFPGPYFDVETGKHYNYFRDYDAGIGRYIESDPVGLSGGVNTYSYVSSSPLVLLDELGLSEADIQKMWDQAQRSFPDLKPRGRVSCADLPTKIYGRTNGFTGNMRINRRYCDKSCLTETEWNDAFFTLFHEGMHSTDPWYRDFWESDTEDKLTRNHQGIYNREDYERGRAEGLRRRIPNPMWGTGNARPVDTKKLYEDYRKDNPACCKSGH
jgi:RHS repeat-associated protein